MQNPKTFRANQNPAAHPNPLGADAIVCFFSASAHLALALFFFVQFHGSPLFLIFNAQCKIHNSQMNKINLSLRANARQSASSIRHCKQTRGNPLPQSVIASKRAAIRLII